MAPGWTKDSSSTGTSLALDGPAGLAAIFSAQPVSSSVTLSQLFQEQLTTFQQNSNLTNVSVCQQPESGNVPAPPIAGGGAEVCFTSTPQGGSAQVWVAIIFDGLVKGTSNQLQVTELAFAPQSDGTTVLVQHLKPVLDSARWLRVSGSG